MGNQLSFKSKIALLVVTFLFLPTFVNSAQAWPQSNVDATVFGGVNLESGEAVVADSLGNLYVGGKYRVAADFDPTSGYDTRTANTSVSAINYDLFISKFDSSGERLWTKILTGPGDEDLVDLSVDSADNLYVAGSFETEMDFDPTSGTDLQSASTGKNGFVSKYDSSGSYLWTKNFGAPNQIDLVQAMELDSSGNIYMVGSFSGTADFNPSINETYSVASAGGNDAFLLKLNSNGQFLQACKFGSGNVESAQGLSVSSSGKIAITGYFQGTGDFNPGSTVNNLVSNGNYDVFVVQVDANCVYQWAISFGSSTGYDYGYGITTDTSDNVFVAGTFSGEVDFNPGVPVETITSISNDIYALMLSPSGVFGWVKSISGAGSDSGNKIVLDAENNVYVAGAIGAGNSNLDSAASNTTVTSLGLTDAIVWKLGSSGQYLGYERIGSTQSDSVYDISVSRTLGKFFVTGSHAAAVSINTGSGPTSFPHYGSADVFTARFSTFAAAVVSSNTNSSSSSESATRLAREERQRQVEAAVGELKSSLASGKPLTPDQFTKADIRGVTAKNVSSINEEIQKLGLEVSQSIVEIARIVFKYEVAGRIEGNVTVYYPELVSAGLAPINSPYKTATLRELKKYPVDKVDSLIEISAAIAEIQQKYEARKNRLKEIINRIYNARS